MPTSIYQLIVATLTQSDALAKLLIEKGVITESEFKQKLLEKRQVPADSGSIDAMIYAPERRVP